MHRSRSQIAEELTACIRCNECLAACPALPLRIPIETLNRETLGEYISPEISHFAEACYQCGACVPVCPVGLHRDAMMLWLKMRLLCGDLGISKGSVRVFSAPVQAPIQRPAAGKGKGRGNDEAMPTLRMPRSSREWNTATWPTESVDEGRSNGRITSWR